ncbi:MAG: hypothetical protein R3D25_06595 [Geminicoccaceae bacterium]
MLSKRQSNSPSRPATRTRSGRSRCRWPAGASPGLRIAALKAAFHDAHKTLFEISDPSSRSGSSPGAPRCAAACRRQAAARTATLARRRALPARRRVYVAGSGWVEARIARFEAMRPDEPLAGPAIVESSFTTVVVDPGTTAARTAGGGLRVTFREGSR